MKIQGPNGLVVDVPGAIATGLVGDGSRGYRFVPDEDAKPTEDTPEVAETPRPRRGRPPKARS